VDLIKHILSDPTQQYIINTLINIVGLIIIPIIGLIVIPIVLFRKQQKRDLVEQGAILVQKNTKAVRFSASAIFTWIAYIFIVFISIIIIMMKFRYISYLDSFFEFLQNKLFIFIFIISIFLILLNLICVMIFSRYGNSIKINKLIINSVIITGTTIYIIDDFAKEIIDLWFITLHIWILLGLIYCIMSNWLISSIKSKPLMIYLQVIIGMNFIIGLLSLSDFLINYFYYYYDILIMYYLKEYEIVFLVFMSILSLIYLYFEIGRAHV
jgi:hypothetical protein